MQLHSQSLQYRSTRQLRSTISLQRRLGNFVLETAGIRSLFSLLLSSRCENCKNSLQIACWQGNLGGERSKGRRDGFAQKWNLSHTFRNAKLFISRSGYGAKPAQFCALCGRRQKAWDAETEVLSPRPRKRPRVSRGLFACPTILMGGARSRARLSAHASAAAG